MDTVNDFVKLCPHTTRSPYSAYETIREAGRPVWLEEHGFFVVASARHVKEVLSDPYRFSSKNPFGPGAIAGAEVLENALSATDETTADSAREFITARGSAMFTADPPVHTAHRTRLNKVFTPRAVARMEPSIQQTCSDLLASLDGEADLVREYASPVAMRTLAGLLGVPEDKTSDFIRWADAINAGLGPAMSTEEVIEVARQQVEFREYFTGQVNARREKPQNDLLTEITLVESDGETLDTNEIIGILSQFLSAGLDTTNKLIAAAMYQLSVDREYQEQLRANPEKIENFIEETARLNSPVQTLFRIATEDVDLGGVRIPEGSYVMVPYGAANRDPEVFENPDAFDAQRSNLRKHFAFGHGIHHCIGAALGRAEARIAMNALLGATTDITLNEERVPYLESYILYGPTRLRVKLAK